MENVSSMEDKDKSNDVSRRELEIIKIKFGVLYRSRPSTIRSTFIYTPLSWCLRILGLLLLSAGIGLIIATAANQLIFDLFYSNSYLYNDSVYRSQLIIIQTYLSFICLISGILFWWLGRLYKKIVTRNLYILELENLLI